MFSSPEEFLRGVLFYVIVAGTKLHFVKMYFVYDICRKNAVNFDVLLFIILSWLIFCNNRSIGLLSLLSKLLSLF